MKILVAAGAPWIREQLIGGLSASNVQVQCVNEGRLVRDALVAYEPDVLIADMQSGNMGGVAVAIDARMEAEEQRCKDVAIILLLDREADRVLAERANVDATMVKPIDIFILAKLVKDLGEHIQNDREHDEKKEELEEVFEDDSEPVTIQIN